MRHVNPFPAAVRLTLAAGLVLASCQSTSPDLLMDDGELWAEAPPAPFRIGISPVAVSPNAARSDEDGFGLIVDSPAAFQAELVRALGDVSAATEVIEFRKKPNLGDPRTKDLDLLIEPRVVDASFDYLGVSGGAFGSATLWVLTWIGGLLVEDGEYQAELGMEFQLVEPTFLSNLGTPIPLRTSTTGLSFFERNDAFNGSFFLTFLLPPFWTPDSADKTSRTLTEHSVQQMAGLLKSHLSGDALRSVSSGPYANIQIDSPINGSAAGPTTDISATITTKEGVSAVEVYVNGKLAGKDSYRQMSAIPEPSKQKKGTSYVASFQVMDLRLPAVSNTIQLVVTLEGDQVTSRTVKVTKAQ